MAALPRMRGKCVGHAVGLRVVNGRVDSQTEIMEATVRTDSSLQENLGSRRLNHGRASHVPCSRPAVCTSRYSRLATPTTSHRAQGYLGPRWLDSHRPSLRGWPAPD